MSQLCKATAAVALPPPGQPKVAPEGQRGAGTGWESLCSAVPGLEQSSGPSLLLEKEPVHVEQGRSSGEDWKRGKSLFAPLSRRQMPVEKRNKSLFALMQLISTRGFPALCSTVSFAIISLFECLKHKKALIFSGQVVCKAFLAGFSVFSEASRDGILHILDLCC